MPGPRAPWRRPNRKTTSRSYSRTMWTMLNTAVGGGFFDSNGQPDATTVFPQQFKIDYVRIADRNDDPLRFRNGGFEGNEGEIQRPEVVDITCHAPGDSILTLLEIGGRTIRAGDKVVLWYMSANRDEAVFADADRFVADRDNARRHLAFGFGIHRCVGARLAELQLATLFEALLDRGLMPVETGDPVRVDNCFVHGYCRLPARLERLT